jgi:hypothetical protein
MKLRAYDNTDASKGYLFFCPGCQELHQYDNRWTFNGDMDKPTFQPSLKYGPSWSTPKGWDPDKAPKNEDGSLKTQENGKVIGAVERTCHLFMTDGKIQFLGDCSHDLKGQTVDCPEIPEWAV